MSDREKKGVTLQNFLGQPASHNGELFESPVHLNHKGDTLYRLAPQEPSSDLFIRIIPVSYHSDESLPVEVFRAQHLEDPIYHPTQ